MAVSPTYSYTSFSCKRTLACPKYKSDIYCWSPGPPKIENPYCNPELREQTLILYHILKPTHRQILAAMESLLAMKMVQKRIELE